MNKTYLLVLGLAIPLLLLVTTAIGTSTRGAELLSIESEIDEVEKEVSLIEENLISETSLKEIKEKVEESNSFVSPENVVYLNNQNPVASLTQ